MDRYASEAFAALVGASVLYSSLLKGEERTIINVKGDGILEGGYVEALACGEVRGYMDVPRLPSHLDPAKVEQMVLALGSGAVGVGNGHMSLQKFLYGQTTPFTTAIPSCGEAEADFQALYTQSEQIPSIFHTRNLIGDDGTPILCGAILVQAIPDADKSTAAGQELIERIKEQLESEEPSMTTLMQSEGVEPYVRELMAKAQNEDLIPRITNTRTIPIDFYCRCSKVRFMQKLKVLNSSDLQSMKDEDDGAELTCKFCNETCELTAADLQTVIDEKAAAGERPKVNPTSSSSSE
jgi:molecular chaperone Hsp33